jgi:hypothetical protein
LGDEQGGELLEHVGAASVIPQVRGDRANDRNRGIAMVGRSAVGAIEASPNRWPDNSR